ncbi:RNA-binding protein 25-like isoform X2 [Varroa jacobsoni]|nr:RNA-binding protein 25-like isoform X2 [Varroa destructor]XP_022692382.1 RNA-binding protein 25-like isoform X2 [Varroa jacobsoni]
MAFPGPRGTPIGGLPLLSAPGFMPRPVLGLQVMPPGVVPVVGVPNPMGMPPMPPHPPERRPPRPQFPKNSSKSSSGQQPADDKNQTITVFVGNITERATDGLVRAVLAKCGFIANWKRAHGANNILQAFGFCDYAEPDAAIRAIRLLNGLEIGDKQLLVKAETKTKDMLAKHEAEQREQRQDYDDFCKQTDREVMEQIQQLMRVHASELKSTRDKESKESEASKERRKAHEKVLLDAMEHMKKLDEDKKSLITREIDKFRDTHMNKEEPAPNSTRRDEKTRSSSKRSPRRRSRSPRSARSPRRSPDSNRERERRRSGERERERERDRERDRDRERKAQRTPVEDPDERYQKELREKAKEREREIARMEREKRREEKKNNATSGANDDTDDEEVYERRRHEKRLREKEANYQEHLKNWEAREKRRAKEYAKDREKEEERIAEEQREAKRLREFFEDYDDERDDVKFYSGSSLQRRVRERAREAEWDQRDRQREREELDELKRRLAEEGHPDPEREALRRQQQHQQQNNSTNVIVISDSADHPIGKMTSDVVQLQDDTSRGMDDTSAHGTGEDVVDGDNSPAVSRKFSKNSNLNSQDPLQKEDERLAREQKEAKERSKEDKRRHMKFLVEKIPSNRDELFAYALDRSLVDEALMVKRVRPWVNKKVIEYIGDEEATLVDFICSKIMAGADAASLLGDVSVVLDDEAENFVVKMWRLLIYEVEAKKMQLNTDSGHNMLAASTSTN